jgi:hypothetical protein
MNVVQIQAQLELNGAPKQDKFLVVFEEKE